MIVFQDRNCEKGQGSKQLWLWSKVTLVLPMIFKFFIRICSSSTYATKRIRAAWASLWSCASYPRALRGGGEGNKLLLCASELQAHNFSCLITLLILFRALCFSYLFLQPFSHSLSTSEGEKGNRKSRVRSIWLLFTGSGFLKSVEKKPGSFKLNPLVEPCGKNSWMFPQ